jgi:hypothetical protein
MFLRGDVDPARQTIGRGYTRQQVLESLRLPGAPGPYFTPGFALVQPLVHAMRITSFDAADPASPAGSAAATAAPPTEPIRSDTGQLTWYPPRQNDGLVAIESPRSQALIGFSAARHVPLTNLALDVRPPFVAVTLSALDAESIAGARRLLLTASARMANHGMQWNSDRTTLTDWGHAPVEIEPVTGRVTLRGLQGATAVSLQPLDGAGQPLGPPTPAVQVPDGWTLQLDAAVAYVINVRR